MSIAVKYFTLGRAIFKKMTETYTGLPQTSNMERFKFSVLDVYSSSRYVSVQAAGLQF